ncbi:MAG TPA: DUF3156 family protein [Actinomycetota bacterium]|nr:DUF3156 family protein [Actinomycetota bacterium]
MRRRARTRARAVLARDVEAFAAAGYAQRGRRDDLGATIARDGRPALRIELVPTGGRIFGGAFAMEVSTADAVLPASGGVSARGRGIVRMHGVRFRGRDDEGTRVGDSLSTDDDLQRALSRVDFEEIRVEPDGRAVIRHLGGAVVWFLFPPMTKPIAIGAAQVRATADALAAFERAGTRVSAGPRVGR